MKIDLNKIDTTCEIGRMVVESGLNDGVFNEKLKPLALAFVKRAKDFHLQVKLEKINENSDDQALKKALIKALALLMGQLTDVDELQRVVKECMEILDPG